MPSRPPEKNSSFSAFVRVRGAREHNLKDVTVELPRDALVVFTGVSGSGKSTLAIGTLYAEARRRYLESVAPYARRLFHQIGAPEFDAIDGLPPTVALQQQRGSPTTRSSVGSVTTLSNLLRMLYSQAPPGIFLRLHCANLSPNERLTTGSAGRARQGGKRSHADGGKSRRRFLYAASRSKPYTVHVYSIDRATGALTLASSAPLPESFPYISLDKTGRFLLGASYGGNLVSVNAVGADGRVAAEPLQVIPVGRNAHSIRVDESNKFVYVPSLGSDSIFMFTFDEKNGKLGSNTPAVFLAKPVSGPRHFVTSSDNRFVYLLSEMAGTVTTFALDGKTGLLSEVSSVSGLPPDTKLGPGQPRVGPPTRNLDNDIWAADIHLTPNGKFLYVSERTGNMLNAFGVDAPPGSSASCRAHPPSGSPVDLRSIPKANISSQRVRNPKRFRSTPSIRPAVRSSSSTSIRRAKAPTGSRSSPMTDAGSR